MLPGLIALPLACAQGLAVAREGVPAFESVHLAFAEEHTGSLVSGFGHLFVCLPDAPVQSTADLLGCIALNFGADIGPLGNGMWTGQFKLQACHELVRKNAFFDQRRVTFFELDLDESFLALLRDDLEQRLTRSYRYDFFRLNCGYYIADWLDGPADLPPPALYITPREALDRVLRKYPPRRIRVIPSDIEILELYLRDLPPATHVEVGKALTDPASLALIQDSVLRLLALRVAESRAPKNNFDRLERLRTETLLAPGGADAARRLLECQELAELGAPTSWPDESEGPAISVGLVHYKGVPELGMRFHLEAGLRDSYTEPRSSHALREAKFLSATVDDLGERQTGDFLLASVSTLRDAAGLRGGGSGGASLGYIGLPDPLGTSGLFAAAWTGLSTRTDSTWLGGRITLAADSLEDRARLLFGPGITLDLEAGGAMTHLLIHHELGQGLGWLAREDITLSDSTALSASWLHSPRPEDVLGLTLQIRF